MTAKHGKVGPRRGSPTHLEGADRGAAMVRSPLIHPRNIASRPTSWKPIETKTLIPSSEHVQPTSKQKHRNKILGCNVLPTAFSPGSCRRVSSSASAPFEVGMARRPRPGVRAFTPARVPCGVPDVSLPCMPPNYPSIHREGGMLRRAGTHTTTAPHTHVATAAKEEASASKIRVVSMAWPAGDSGM